MRQPLTADNFKQFTKRNKHLMIIKLLQAFVLALATLQTIFCESDTLFKKRSNKSLIICG